MKQCSSWHGSFTQSVSPINIGSELHQQWTLWPKQNLPKAKGNAPTAKQMEGQGHRNDSTCFWSRPLKEAKILLPHLYWDFNYVGPDIGLSDTIKMVFQLASSTIKEEILILRQNFSTGYFSIKIYASTKTLTWKLIRHTEESTDKFWWKPLGSLLCTMMSSRKLHCPSTPIQVTYTLRKIITLGSINYILPVFSIQYLYRRQLKPGYPAKSSRPTFNWDLSICF